MTLILLENFEFIEIQTKRIQSTGKCKENLLNIYCCRTLCLIEYGLSNKTVQTLNFYYFSRAVLICEQKSKQNFGYVRILDKFEMRENDQTFVEHKNYWKLKLSELYLSFCCTSQSLYFVSKLH